MTLDFWSTFELSKICLSPRRGHSKMMELVSRGSVGAAKSVFLEAILRSLLDMAGSRAPDASAYRALTEGPYVAQRRGESDAGDGLCAR